MKVGLCFSNDDNFGDRLNEDLFRFLGFDPRYAQSGHAEVCGMGSILGWLVKDADFRGIAFGSGLISESDTFDGRVFRSCLLLRGPLTAARIGREPIFGYSDPGILARHIYPSSASLCKGTLILPHYADQADAGWLALANRLGCRVSDIRCGTTTVAREIADSGAVITSSLHGVIVADSYGVPSIWIRSPAVLGGEFKFRDYLMGIGYRRESFHLSDVSSASMDGMLCAAPLDAVNAATDRVLIASRSLFRRLLVAKTFRKLRHLVRGSR